jgi:hypothetical protein
MNLQVLITGLLVAACAVYCAWSLMPAVLRQGLAKRMLTFAPKQAWLQRAARPASGCGSGCDGCGEANPASATGTKVIRIHKQPPS